MAFVVPGALVWPFCGRLCGATPVAPDLYNEAAKRPILHFVFKPTNSFGAQLADANGLCIEVRPSGAKVWRYRYRHLGKASIVTLGE